MTGGASRRGGVVTMTVNTVDAGERKEMFGFNARHLKQTMMTESSPDACQQQHMKMERDGWYINLEYGLNCGTERPPQMGGRMAPQGCRIRRSNDRQIEAWSQVMRNTIEAVNPRCAHRTWLRLFFAVHELINDDRPVWPGEKLAESYASNGRVSCIEFHGNFLEHIILDGRTLWKPATQFRDPHLQLGQPPIPTNPLCDHRRRHPRAPRKQLADL